MKYLDRTFSLPVCASEMTDLEYALRVGNITQTEFDQATNATLPLANKPIEVDAAGHVVYPDPIMGGLTKNKNCETSPLNCS